MSFKRGLTSCSVVNSGMFKIKVENVSRQRAVNKGYICTKYLKRCCGNAVRMAGR